MWKYIRWTLAVLFALLIYVTVKGSPGTWLVIGGLMLFAYFAWKGRHSGGGNADDDGDDLHAQWTRQEEETREATWNRSNRR